MLRFFIISFLFIWELPQNLLGLIVLAIMKFRQHIVIMEKQEHRFYVETPKTGVSLGWFVFWTPSGNRFSYLVNDCRMHEYGHSRQSAMLGPLYLIVVGIPSVLRVFYRYWYLRKYGSGWKNYYNAFPENWADKLGGVIKQG